MWISRDEYRNLLAQSAESQALVRQLQERLADLRTQLADLKHDLELERARANAAVDAALVEKGHAPITPTEVPDPNTLFDEDPNELARMSKAIAEGGILSVLEEARE